MSYNFRFELRLGIFLYFYKKKMVSEIKRIPLMEMSGSTSEIHVHLYIVIQCGLSSICEKGTTISVVLFW
jgi:hypothetical protein